MTQRSKLKQFATFREMEKFVNDNEIEVTKFFLTPSMNYFCIFYKELNHDT